MLGGLWVAGGAAGGGVGGAAAGGLGGANGAVKAGCIGETCFFFLCPIMKPTATPTPASARPRMIQSIVGKRAVGALFAPVVGPAMTKTVLTSGDQAPWLSSTLK